MSTVYDRIWETALPVQDKRDDTGHAAVTYAFARRLVESAGGVPEVVLPAIILHDTGWSALSRDERFVIFRAGVTPEEELVVRFKHQDEGVKIAAEVLESVEYPQEHREEILEIISQHDTRKGFLSHNEGLVRDADKLWRFSKIGFDADVERFEYDPAFLHEKIICQIDMPGFFYSDTARKLAHEELAERRTEYGISWAGSAPEPGIVCQGTPSEEETEKVA